MRAAVTGSIGSATDVVGQARSPAGLALAERTPELEALFLVPVDPERPDLGLELHATSGLSGLIAPSDLIRTTRFATQH